MHLPETILLEEIANLELVAILLCFGNDNHHRTGVVGDASQGGGQCFQCCGTNAFTPTSCINIDGLDDVQVVLPEALDVRLSEDGVINIHFLCKTLFIKLFLILCAVKAFNLFITASYQ